ncbi:hypothetical protein ETI11_01345 [Macrococcoides canis]|uniref:YopX family protein n=1 Tax=Macrococcoides canis TaxID=1855823 RepID=UPI001060F522|nr:YopX family protein [Macrococcus canis]TDM32711.1 hypothetical protein ETI03_03155 [Macrococcus canis]TDM38065.1 hypothetical protein ETI11_01345 [Macrococcus canis]
MIPKFRAWDEVIDQMFIPDSIHFDSKGMVDGIGSKKTVFGIEDFELMQSTGLHDKNGKEIFEGDIVKVSQDDEYFISFVKNMIEFDCPGFDVPFPDDWNYECNVLSHVMNTEQNIEIIGNIHEHSELLEEDGDVIDKN